MDIDNSGALEITVYFDFLCPYAYQASLWVREMRDIIGSDEIRVDWKFFSLEENSWSKEREGWHIWDQKPSGEIRGLLPFLVGAAVHQAAGEEGLDRFYLALGRTLHEEGLPIWERQHLEAALTEIGIDPTIYAEALEGKSQAGYDKIKRDHTQGVEKYGIFGSSSLVFENSKAIYLKVMPRPTGTQAVELFQFAQRIALGLPMIQEIKRVNTPEQEELLKEAIRFSL
jgi:predicted DsbA family dithiol-disulfide isomerase